MSVSLIDDPKLNALVGDIVNSFSADYYKDREENDGVPADATQFALQHLEDNKTRVLRDLIAANKDFSKEEIDTCLFYFANYFAAMSCLLAETAQLDY